jgi:hypothetical protein
MCHVLLLSNMRHALLLINEMFREYMLTLHIRPRQKSLVVEKYWTNIFKKVSVTEKYWHI